MKKVNTLPRDDSSPSLSVIEKRKIEHRIDLDDKEFDVKLESCCGGKTDKRLLDHVSKLSISILVLGFAGVQMTRIDASDGMMPFYSSLVTFVLGAWMKLPDQAKKK